MIYLPIVYCHLTCHMGKKLENSLCESCLIKVFINESTIFALNLSIYLKSSQISSNPEYLPLCL